MLQLQSLDGFLGENCYGLCTHAYAVTKQVAQYLPIAVYNAKVLNDQTIKLDADQALLDYFENQNSPIKPYLFGFNVVHDVLKDSKLVQNYKGIIIQEKAQRHDHFFGGTSLHNNDFVQTTCFHFHHLKGNASSKSGSAGKSVVTVGDALFAYASLVGLCFLRKTHPDYCASTYIANHANITAVTAIRLAFDIPLPSEYLRCPSASNLSLRKREINNDKNASISNDNSDSSGGSGDGSNGIDISSSFFSVNGYSPQAMLQPSGTVFTGRLTSPRLFEDSSLAGALLRSRLVFPSFYAARSAKLFLSQEEIISSSLQSGKKMLGPSDHVVCILASIDSISLQKDFYEAALRTFSEMRASIIFAVFNERGGHLDRPQKDHMHYNDNEHVVKMLKISTTGLDNAIIVKGARNVSHQMLYQHYPTEPERGLILLYRLSQCQNMILSGSALGWWAGWLNRNATIIVPRAENSLANWIQL